MAHRTWLHPVITNLAVKERQKEVVHIIYNCLWNSLPGDVVGLFDDFDISLQAAMIRYM